MALWLCSRYFFVDLLVFPTPVLEAWPNATGGTTGGKVQWNNATKQLLQVLADETFARFPGCDGWIVRTGETYTCVLSSPLQRRHIGLHRRAAQVASLWTEQRSR